VWCLRSSFGNVLVPSPLPSALMENIEQNQLLMEMGDADHPEAKEPSSARAVERRLPKAFAAAAGLAVVGAVAWASWPSAAAGASGGAAAHGDMRGVVGLAKQVQVVVERSAANASTTRAPSSTVRPDEDESLCSAQGASCLVSKCCKSPGTQCYTKDNYWGQCMESCTPGPNIRDQTSPMPWACQVLGPRTPGKVPECSDDGDDCSSTKCCKIGGTQCFKKNEFWAACKPQCTPGPDLTAPDSSPWDCEALGARTLGAAPWVPQQCAQAGEDCRQKACCADAGNQCYKQGDYFGQCKTACTPGEKLNPWDTAWACDTIGERTPPMESAQATSSGMVAQWVADTCSPEGENCLDSKCCFEVGATCYKKNDYWASCKTGCDTAPDPNDGNRSWSCESTGPKSWGLATKGWPSLYCVTLFMPSGYEGGLLKAVLDANAGIFQCDGYDVFAAENSTLGVTKDNITVRAILIPQIAVGVSQDGTAGNAKLFMAVWDKVIAGNRFRNFDWTIKVDPDAVLIPWRIRDHMRPHVGANVYVVNCNKFPGSPNFPMMYGAVEIFSQVAMVSYAMNSWKCGQQLPWGTWGEDYYMTHCMDFIGVGRIGDFGVLGDNMCTGANCHDAWTGSFHPFKNVGVWMECWGQATVAS